MNTKHTPMVIAAARAMCRIASEACNVNNDDNWMTYGDGYLDEAATVLDAAGVPALVIAAGQASFALRELLPNDPDAQMTVQMLKAVISKATGEQK